MCGVPLFMAGLQQRGVPAGIHFDSSRENRDECRFSSAMVPVAGPGPPFSMSPASAGRYRLGLPQSSELENPSEALVQSVMQYYCIQLGPVIAEVSGEEIYSDLARATLSFALSAWH